MNKKKHWVKFALLSTALVPFIGAVSTINAINGTSAPAAIAYNLQDAADAWRAYVESKSRDANSVTLALRTVDPIRVSICEDAEGELLDGRLSGSPGPGRIFQSYNSACKYIGNITETLTEMETEQAERRAALSDLLSELKTLPRDKDQNVFERSEKFEFLLSDIEELLSESATSNVGDMLKVQLENLNASVSSSNVSEGAFGKRQRQAIEDLKAYLETIENSIGSLVTPDAQLVSYTRPDKLLPMHEAVWAYRDRLWPAIILAIGVDSAVLWFAFAIGLSNAVLRDRKVHVQAVANNYSQTNREPV